MPFDDLDTITDFLYELGLLKRSKRTGWWAAGIKDPESVAEHSFRTAIIGYLLAQLEGADAGRTAIMCLLHDSQETRTGDIPAVGKQYLTAASNEQVTADQTAGFPGTLASAVRDLVNEYELRQSIEAQLAHDADKLELVLQSREYQAQGGYDTADWLHNSLAALKTTAAQQLAAAACQVPPDTGGRLFAAATTTADLHLDRDTSRMTW
jgi:putative hydrolases of HD superfamily